MSDSQRGDGAPPSHVHIGKKKGRTWWPWILAALALLALLLLLSRCSERDAMVADQAAPAPASAPATSAPTPALAVEQVTLPGGRTIGLTPQTLNYELQRFLASQAAAPRTFTFENLNFDTNASTIRSADEPTIAALGQILKAYPKAKVRLVGYADARGTGAANQQLGAQRAAAVAQALTRSGVEAGRVDTASGGEGNPVDSNATSAGRFENRRTELIVTSK